MITFPNAQNIRHKNIRSCGHYVQNLMNEYLTENSMISNNSSPATKEMETKIFNYQLGTPDRPEI